MAIHKKGDFREGIYRPIHHKKFLGKKYPQYRSSWELHFFKWCDHNPNVLEWGSENIIVPYISPLDNRAHRYYVDNYIAIKEKIGLAIHLIYARDYRAGNK